MASTAMARETVCALRREIAKIEGVLPARLEETAPARPSTGLISSGAGRFDQALGGGLPKAGLTEIHGAQTRNAGAAAGFALAATALAGGREAPASLLWIGCGEVLAEAGCPHAPGLAERFGFAPGALLLARIPRVEDALWMAEEAAGVEAFSAILLECRGDVPKLDLTATRRLHRRAGAGGRPLLLLRHAAHPQPTAAPLRLCVAPAPAGERTMLSGTLAGSIGPPAFAVTVAKSRLAACASFILEWNAHERLFEERPARSVLAHERRRTGDAQDPFAVVSPAGERAYPARSAGQVVAFRNSA